MAAKGAVTLTGVPASVGIAEGHAIVYERSKIPFIDGPGAGADYEIGRITEAAHAAIAELQLLKEHTRTRLGDEYAHIFRSQQTIAEDDSILGEVAQMIREQDLCAEAALRQVFAAYRSLFEELDDDDYNKARLADIEDVGMRIMRKLVGVAETSLADLSPGSIVIAEDLYPSDTMLMDPASVAGLVTEQGGATSHVAILAKNLGIPAAVRVRGVASSCADGQSVILDSSDTREARVHISPSAAVRAELSKRRSALDRHRRRVESMRGAEPVTTDGRAITLSANVGSTAELGPAREAGAGSIGLYRSEFLFLNSPNLPDEEAQYRAYREAAEAFRDGPVIIRTLDIGGDKMVPSIPMPEEANPFLGNRALRLCLSRPQLFRTQLRAILRASSAGNLKVMFPMVGGLPELDRALALLEETRAELLGEGVAVDPELEIGVMIEIPAAVWVAPALARRVSFFSVGTNDLTQYLMAADRLNGEIEEYYRPYDPAVFRAIYQVVTAAREAGIWVGVCGELGGDPLAIPALIGMGVTELSMSPISLAEATWLIRTGNSSRMQELARRVLSLDDHAQIRALLETHYTAKE
mgnify:CR=1 FL=1